MSEAHVWVVLGIDDACHTETVLAAFETVDAAHKCSRALNNHKRSNPDTDLENWDELFREWVEACPIPGQWGYSRYDIRAMEVFSGWLG